MSVPSGGDYRTLGGNQRHRSGEYTAVAEFAGHLDIPTEQSRQAARDRQAEAGPAKYPCRRRICLAERFEQPVDDIRRDADTGIAHRETRRGAPPKVVQVTSSLTEPLAVSLMALPSRLEDLPQPPGSVEM
jgi:hypothetical protein